MTRTPVALAWWAVIAFVASVSLAPASAQAQGGGCVPGQNCCVVGMSMDTPKRYAVACDGAAQTASGAATSGGYPLIVFGPSTFEQCGAWMSAAGIPGWERFANVPLPPGTGLPKPDASCFLGRNCCYVGASWDRPPRYAIGYDGAVSSGSHALITGGYPSIVYGPVSIEACHAWWNDNIAARGLGAPFPAAGSGAVPFQAGAFRAPPPRGPSGPQGPRSAGPTAQTGISVALSANAWVQASQYVGAVTGGDQGLLLAGGPWTNGRLVNGHYDGNRVLSRETFDFSAGGDVYMAFAVNGGGKYMGFYPRLIAGVSVKHMTTNHSWAGSVVVPERTWLFGHVRVEPDGSYRLTVAQGRYDDHGGQVILGTTGRLASPSGQLEFQFVDNYAGAAASVLIGEAWVYAGGAGVPHAATPGPSAGRGPARPAGASCGTNEDCASSVCLLGVCAPPSR